MLSVGAIAGQSCCGGAKTEGTGATQTCAKAQGCVKTEGCAKTAEGCAKAKECADKHLLTIKDGKAYCCACAADCKCTLNADDATTCSCGKPVSSCDLKGKYVCEMCNVIADEAGKCGKCDMELKKVE